MQSRACACVPVCCDSIISQSAVPSLHASTMVSSEEVGRVLNGRANRRRDLGGKPLQGMQLQLLLLVQHGIRCSHVCARARGAAVVCESVCVSVCLCGSVSVCVCVLELLRAACVCNLCCICSSMLLHDPIRTQLAEPPHHVTCLSYSDFLMSQ